MRILMFSETTSKLFGNKVSFVTVCNCIGFIYVHKGHPLWLHRLTEVATSVSYFMRVNKLRYKYHVDNICLSLFKMNFMNVHLRWE